MVSEKLKNDFYQQAKINLNDFIKNPPKDNKTYQRKLRVIVELLNHSIQFEVEVEGDLRNIFMNFLYTQLNDLIILYETLKKEETKEIKKIKEIKEKILFLLEQFRDFTRLNNIESQNLYYLERIIEKLF